MKIIKWLFGSLAVLALLLVVGGLLLSGDFRVTRSIEVAAAPAKVYALVQDPRRWAEWAVWHRRDPAMQITYFGAPSGQGAGWAWVSASQGDGKMTFTSAETDRRLAYDLYFPDFGTTSTGDMQLVPTASGTRVTWTMTGNMGRNPVFRWMALFADGMVGKDFDGGLANLKAVAEKP
jgi:uncharacterized protein YndB with AHSA1/START domain